MKKNALKMVFYSFMLISAFSCQTEGLNPSEHDAIIIDHTCTDIFKIPVSFIDSAKKQLIIAYGHTSHGSQLISAMYPLDEFMKSHGYTNATFVFNEDGSQGALRLLDCPFSGAQDLGNPDRTAWASATRDFLLVNKEVNVVMWSWCGQAGYATSDEIDLYLNKMSELEKDYPNVTFVYMTGHLDGTGKEGQLNKNNERIRKYCRENHKVLYDFADIESYSPDGKTNYMELYANDNCDYTSATGVSKNWAIDWQNSHQKDIDWYDCEVAHSQPLNGNLKAFAAWWLFARLAGWKPDEVSTIKNVKDESHHFSYYFTNDCLVVNAKEKIAKLELFDISGKRFFSLRDHLSQVSIPLSRLPVKQSIILRVVADKKNYSLKLSGPF